jgi:hypothetical protein
MARDQSAGQIMQLSAGDESSTVLPQAKKCCASAVARAGGFGLREQAKEGKRDTCRRGWSRAVVARDQSAGQIMQLSTAGFGLREQAKEGKRDT